MRLIAKRQQQRRAAQVELRPATPGRPPRSHLILQSVIDNWRWRPGGRPSLRVVPVLLLRVEVWRDVRAQVQPVQTAGDGRVTRADALAEVLVFDMKTHDRAIYAKVDTLRRRYENQQGRLRTRPLTRAVDTVIHRHFRALQTQFSQTLDRYQCSKADLDHARDLSSERGESAARRTAGRLREALRGRSRIST
jgi:hypothetical protein